MAAIYSPIELIPLMPLHFGTLSYLLMHPLDTLVGPPLNCLLATGLISVGKVYLAPVGRERRRKGEGRLGAQMYVDV